MLVAFLVIWGLLPASVAIWLLLLWRQESAPDRVPILCYHRLVRGDSDLDPAVATADPEPSWVAEEGRFARQAEWLAANGWQTLDLDDWLAIRAGERPRPPRGILLTFDDGYGSVAEIAGPILARHGMKATVFAVLEPDEHSVELVAGKDRFMQPAELRALAEAGWSVQSHSVTHAMLTYLDDARLDWELTESRRRLEEITGRPVRHICLPRSGVDERVIAHVARAGYATCCGIGKGTARFSSPPLRLPRLAPLRHHGAEALARMLRPATATLDVALARLRILAPRLLGARLGYRLRTFLYGSPLRHVFGPRALLRSLALAALLWLGGGVWLLGAVWGLW